MNLSPEQSAVSNFVKTGKGSAIVEAVAGSGKTTTLIHLMREAKGSIAFMAFNNSIVEEIRNRLKGTLSPEDAQRVKVATFHSFGMGAWLKFANKKMPVTESKSMGICTLIKVPNELQAFVCKLVGLAKQRALGVVGSVGDTGAWRTIVDHFELDQCLTDSLKTSDASLEELIELGIAYAKQVLQASNDAGFARIDFDDMIYLPLIHNARFGQFDWIFVDEAQDTNPARRAMARKILKPGGRSIWVGDPHQAIYGFTGADSDSLDLIANDFGAKRFPLATTFRCPKAVVTLAQQYVSHIRSAESAPEGQVSSMTEPEFEKLPKESLTKEDVIICRNTKPLVAIAYQLLRRGIGCHIEGRDIGLSLKILVKKIKADTVGGFIVLLDDYRDDQVSRLMAKGQEAKAEALDDRVAALHVIIEDMEEASPKDWILQKIDALFQTTPDGIKSPNVTLSTVHKAKGREWNRVYLYKREAYMPSKWARQPWQLAQEINLIYVAITRTRQHLIEIG